MQDFRDEVECYLHTKQIVNLLDSLDLTSQPFSNLEAVYDNLSGNGLINNKELSILEAWLSDIKRFYEEV
jgi:hypothetical protein